LAAPRPSSTAESFEEEHLPAPSRPATRSRFGREDVEFSRAIGFVDATFAIAATLLGLSPVAGRWANRRIAAADGTPVVA
jgi:hypothetical protein